MVCYTEYQARRHAGMHGVDEILLSFKAMQDTFIHISLMIQIALFPLPFRISLGLELFINANGSN